MSIMRTTVDLSDDLFRRAKSEAALRGKKFKDLVEEGLHLVLDGTQPRPPVEGKRETVYDRMKHCIGIVESGVPDLATNPKYLEGFGSDSMGDR
jgi:hypothetical protein